MELAQDLDAQDPEMAVDAGRGERWTSVGELGPSLGPSMLILHGFDTFMLLIRFLFRVSYLMSSRKFIYNHIESLTYIHEHT